MLVTDENLSCRTVTPKEVLELLIEIHQVDERYGEAEEGQVPHFEMTLREWEDSRCIDFEICFPSGGMGRYFNNLFGVDISKTEWYSLLKRKKVTTLRSVCEKIATHAKVPLINPVTILGTHCQLAGIFLSIRKSMQARGVDVCDLRPSSSLSSYSDTAFPLLWRDLLLLAPRLVSRMETHYASDLGCIACAALLVFSMLIGAIVSFASPLIGIPWAVLSVYAFILIWRLSEKRQEKPLWVEFTGLRTFRDLCVEIATPTNTSTVNP